MAEHLKLAKSGGEPVTPPDFILTDTARTIHRALRMVRQLSGFRIGLVCGNAGIGKTTALEAFWKEDEAVWMMTAAGGEDEAKAVAEDLCGRLGVYGWENMTLTARRKAILRSLSQVEMLIIDEAQHLKLTAIEWVRSLCEEAGCNLVLAGDAKLYMMATCNKQIESRAVLPLLLHEVFPADVQGIAAAHGLDRDGITRELEAVAFQSGGVRHVRNVIELGTAFANGAPVSLEHIRAARGQLGLQGVK